MSKAARLHPISAVMTLLKLLKEFTIPFLVFVVFGDLSLPLTIIVTCLFIVFLIVFSFLSWFRFTYRLEDEEIRIQYGVIVRKKRYIPFERIQSLDFSENILHQLFGLVKISVETAGSEGTEAVLTAVTKKQAETIQEILNQRKQTGAVAEQDGQEALPAVHEEIIYKITSRELVLLASTSGGIGVVITAVIAFISQFDEWIPFEKLTEEFISFALNQIFIVSILVLIGLLLAWVVAVIGMMLKYADFTLKKTDKDLVITRGLLEKKKITIPLKRIQGIRISENILRQPFKLATVYLISAGGTEGEGTGTVVILPLIKKKRIKELLSPHLDYQFIENFTPAPKRSLKRYMFRGLVIVLPILLVPVFFFKFWGLLGFLTLPMFIYWFYLKYKDAGWSIDEDQLSLRFRGLTKHTIFMQRKNIQSLRSRTTYFQKRKDLSSIMAFVKSGIGLDGGTVTDLERKDVEAVYQWFSRS